jgi:hypothetical protein
MKLAGFLVGTLVAISALGATSAAAATEFGDNCVANQVTEPAVPVTLFALTATGDPLSLTAPSAGVITSWKLNQVFGPVATPHRLKVLRQTGPLSVQVVGESAPAVPTLGSSTFDTRIPVQGGDRLGLFVEGKGQLLFCLAPGEKNQIGLFEGAAVGSSVAVMTLEKEPARIPVAATVEPDADNDGYGDETQDKCPQNAATQTACPVAAPIAPIVLGTTAVPKKGLVNVLVTSTPQASVAVAGTVKLGKGKSVKLSGGTQIVAPGAIAKFTLVFPEKLKGRLKELSRKRSLWLNLAATAPNAAGAISTSNLKVKLKGQANPEPKPKLDKGN